MNLTGVIITAIMYLPLPQENLFTTYLCNLYTHIQSWSVFPKI